jgi:hypothetical protein
MKNLDLAISQLESILIPFASNPVWDKVHTHMKLHPNQPMENGGYWGEPESVLHDAWWEYFTNLGIKASIVFDLMRCFSGESLLYDGTPYLLSYIQEVGIDLKEDTWEQAFKKLHKLGCTFSFDGCWSIWLIHSEFLFKYNCQDDPLAICTSYVKHLEAHISKNIEDYIHYQE